MAGGRTKAVARRARTRASRTRASRTRTSRANSPPNNSNKKLKVGESNPPEPEPVSKNEKPAEPKLQDVKILTAPLASARDQHKYRNILLENGIRCLLISSCRAEEATIEEFKEIEAVLPAVDEKPAKQETSIFNRTRRGKRPSSDSNNVAAKRFKDSKAPYCGEKPLAKMGSFISALATSVTNSIKSLFVAETLDEEYSAGWLLPEPADGMQEDDKDVCKRVQKSRYAFGQLSLSIACGSINDPPNARGLSEVVQHLILNRMNHSEYFNGDAYSNFGVDAENTSVSCVFEGTTDVLELLTRFTNGLFKVFEEDMKFDVQSILDTMDRRIEGNQCRRKWFGFSSAVDNRRMSLLFSLAKEGHPVRQISEGKPDELAELLNSNNRNESNLKNVAAEFFKTHYLASAMTLTIEAVVPLDNLQEMVARAFQVFSGGERLNPISGDANPFQTDNFTRFYTVKCSSRTCLREYEWDYHGGGVYGPSGEYLVLTWALPPEYWENYEVKPLAYLAAIISDERNGGLSNYLRKRNFIISLDAGCPDDSHRTRFCSLFEIKVKLRVEGLQAVDQIVEAIFSYLKFLKSRRPFRGFYEELRKLQLFNFNAHARIVEQAFGGTRFRHFRSERSAVGLQYFKPEDILVGHKLFHHFDEEIIQACTELLVPQLANYMLCVNEPGKDDDLIEAIYKTKYSVDDVPSEQIEKWQNVDIFAEFQSPKPNRFINRNLCLNRPQSDSKEIILYKPENGIINHQRIWYQQMLTEENDCSYEVHLMSTIVALRPENAAMRVVGLRMLNEQLVPIFAELGIAEIRANLRPTKLGVIISLRSWNNTIVPALKAIFAEIVNLNNAGWTPEFFERTRNDAINSLAASAEQSVQDDLYSWLTVVDHITIPESIQELREIDFEQTLDFFQKFLNKISIVAMVKGNIDNDNVADLSDAILEYFAPNDITPLMKIRMFQLPRGEHIMRYQSVNPNSTTDNVINYYQIGRSDVRLRSIAHLASFILLEYPWRIYSENKASKKSNNKTKSSSENAMENANLVIWVSENKGVLTITAEIYFFNFDGPSLRADEMNKLIQDALDQANVSALGKISPKEFDQLKHEFTHPQEYSRIFMNIQEYSRSYDLDPIQDLTLRFDNDCLSKEAFEQIKLADLQNFWSQYMMSTSPQIRKVSIQTLRAKIPEKSELVKHEYKTHEERQKLRKEGKCSNPNYDKWILSRPGPNADIVYKLESDTEDCNDDRFIVDPEEFTRKLAKFPIRALMS